MLDFYNKSNPKARKDHVCEYCGKTIHKGEIYSYETGKYDGDMFARKLCLVCENILDAFIKEVDADEFDWWEINDWLRDLYCYNCEHRADGKDGCEIQPQNCHIIRKRFHPKEDTENANPAN